MKLVNNQKKKDEYFFWWGWYNEKWRLRKFNTQRMLLLEQKVKQKVTYLTSLEKLMNNCQKWRTKRSRYFADSNERQKKIRFLWGHDTAGDIVLFLAMYSENIYVYKAYMFIFIHKQYNVLTKWVWKFFSVPPCA